MDQVAVRRTHGHEFGSLFLIGFKGCPGLGQENPRGAVRQYQVSSARLRINASGVMTDFRFVLRIGFDVAVGSWVLEWNKFHLAESRHFPIFWDKAGERATRRKDPRQQCFLLTWFQSKANQD